MNVKIQKTKTALREAVLALVEEHSLRDITVSELCKKAGINRTTFYKYYSVPSDVIEEYLADVQDRVFSTVRMPKENEEESLYERMLQICRVYYTDPVFAKLFTCYHYNNSSYIEKQFSKGDSAGTVDKYLIHFMAGGVDAVLSRWITDGFKETPEVIAQKLVMMISKMILL